jgi:hypothetical protein
MAFYSMHEGAGLASERAVPNASGELIGQHCGTMSKGVGQKNGRDGFLASTSRERNAAARQRCACFDFCCGPFRSAHRS